MTSSTRGPRTLAEELRGREDAALGALLRARADLLNPVPTDLTQLATRLSTRASVVRALERLDRFTLQVAEALAVAPDGCTPERLHPLVGADPGDTDRALATLREQALLWGADGRLHLPRTVRDVLAPPGEAGPTGLGPALAEAVAGMSPARLQQYLADLGVPSTHDSVSAAAALTALFTDDEQLAKLLAGAPKAALDVLGRLVWGPPVGSVPDAQRAVRAAEARSPVEWLLARALLLPAGRETVLLPREVALHLRGGRVHRAPEPHPPQAAGRAYEPEVVDRAAAGQAFGAVRLLEELLDLLGTAPPPVLRTGGLGVRELRRTAAALDLPEPETAFWLELAYGAGLLAADGEVDEAFAPTPGYDEWLRRPVADRWLTLVRAWLAGTRVPGLVGGKDNRGKVLAALGPELDRSLAPEIRRRVLAVLAGLPPGGAADPDGMAARLAWEVPLRGAETGAGRSASDPETTTEHGPAPRRGGLRERLAAWTLAEAELLGVTGRGALGGPARALLAAGDAEPDARADRAAALLAPLLPEPLDEVILQPDLTAIAPGPLHTHLAQSLALVADVESKGGATVYRFTPESVRRALDAGRTADDLHAFLAEHSRTPVPQPLTYLVDDIARRHGRLRVGAAGAYLRCDDASLLGEVLADRRAAALRLRRLAPTVVAAQAGPEAVLTTLRAMGLAPAAESPDGDVLITRPDARRTPPRTPPTPVPEGPPVPREALLSAAVRAIRAGDRASTAPRRDAVPGPASGASLPRTAAAETLAAIQTAVLTGERVWIGYVNAEGAASQRVVEPVRVEGGYVTAYDHLRDEMRTFALHRITGVAELTDEEPA